MTLIRPPCSSHRLIAGYSDTTTDDHAFGNFLSANSVDARTVPESGARISQREEPHLNIEPHLRGQIQGEPQNTDKQRQETDTSQCPKQKVHEPDTSRNFAWQQQHARTGDGGLHEFGILTLDCHLQKREPADAERGWQSTADVRRCSVITAEIELSDRDRNRTCHDFSFLERDDISRQKRKVVSFNF
jgi:hypothetical protein